MDKTTDRYEKECILVTQSQCLDLKFEFGKCLDANVQITIFD